MKQTRAPIYRYMVAVLPATAPPKTQSEACATFTNIDANLVNWPLTVLENVLTFQIKLQDYMFM